jgi:uncharacterized cupredoxin-like copper-binding protein
VRFIAARAGTYYYLCQVPGHAQMGMYGELVLARIGDGVRISAPRG